MNRIGHTSSPRRLARLLLGFTIIGCGPVFCEETGSGGGTSLTIHTENFAVVRDPLELDIPMEGGSFSYEGATADLEPTSVILLGENGVELPILEQSYRNDTLNTAYLLSLFEGKTINFLSESDNGQRTVFPGKVVRSGYDNGGRGASGEPIIQVDGSMRFGLPGTPLFPDLGGDTLLKPRLEWKIGGGRAYKGAATVSYITGGMGWSASYNLVLPEKGGEGVIRGWVSLLNQTGRDFADARVKLLAGEVRREQRVPYAQLDGEPGGAAAARAWEAPAVARKTFDDYHMYELPKPVRLRDRETKQVEFLSSDSVGTETVYRLLIADTNGMDTAEGAKGKVDVVRRFKNSEADGLGVPMPGGVLRVYRMDGDEPEFLGESSIEHTPADETVEITTGTAFDIVGRKTRTEREDLGPHYLGGRSVREAYEITITNRKKEAVTVNLAERIQGGNWTVEKESHPRKKTAAGEVQWDIPVEADSKATLSYELSYRYP